MINETAQATIEVVKGQNFDAVIIFVWILVVSVFGLVTWLNSLGSKTKPKWGNFWKIWGWTSAITGTVVAWIIMSPLMVDTVIKWILNL